MPTGYGVIKIVCRRTDSGFFRPLHTPKSLGAGRSEGGKLAVLTELGQIRMTGELTWREPWRRDANSL